MSRWLHSDTDSPLLVRNACPPRVALPTAIGTELAEGFLQPMAALAEIKPQADQDRSKRLTIMSANR